MKPECVAALLFALFVSALASCSASVSTKTSLYPGASHLPPSDPAHVQILQSESDRRHERLGEVRVEVMGKEQSGLTEGRLKQAGSKMGADAVVIVDRKTERISGPPSLCPTPAHDIQTITAIAIRYSG